MKKRILSLTLAILMVATTLIGCGNDTTKENTTNTEATTETPTTTPETNVPETETSNVDSTEETFSVLGTYTFPEGMNGFTEKYVSNLDSNWSKNGTHYIDIHGNEMNFTWNGPTTLGEMAGYNGKTLDLTGGDYELLAWHGGSMSMEDITPCLEATKDVWTSSTANVCTLPENGYYKNEQIGNTVVITYEVIHNSTSNHGFVRFLCDADNGEVYNFMYLEKPEVYNAERAMEVIESFEFWNLELTNE